MPTNAPTAGRGDTGLSVLPAKANRIGPGLWRWTARHPEWHPGDFGAEVASFALDAGGDLLLIDPLLPPGDEAPVLDLLDGLAADRDVHVLITIGYHVRSAEQLCERYGGRGYGPHTCASRLRDTALLTELEPREAGPAGGVGVPIGPPPPPGRAPGA